MQITFMPQSQEAEWVSIPPAPGSTKIPSWFAKKPRHMDGDRRIKLNMDGTSNLSIKACNPFMDSFLTGYIISLNVDLQVRFENGQPTIVWKTGDPISTHSPQQVSEEIFLSGFAKIPLKFHNDWIIKTPRGYSSLFTHPLNRTDLPFYTLAGVVETDKYGLPVSLPFLIREGFEGIIPQGTPIAQVIPIKREPWVSKTLKFSAKEFLQARHQVFAKIEKFYKLNIWVKKSYK